VATITRLKSGSWRVQVRRKRKYVNETFLRRKDVEEWSIDIERRIDRQEPTTTRQSRDVQLFRRSHRAPSPRLERGREGKERALEGAGPVTVGIDLGYIKTILSHAAAVHSVVLSTEPIDPARIALGRLGLDGSRHSKASRRTSTSANSGQKSQSDSHSTRSSKCRD
jgi:hypothetical protein